MTKGQWIVILTLFSAVIFVFFGICHILNSTVQNRLVAEEIATSIAPTKIPNAIATIPFQTPPPSPRPSPTVTLVKTTPSMTPTRTATVRPTVTKAPSNQLYATIRQIWIDYRNDQLTSLQFETKMNGLIGKQDIWQMTILGVYSDNSVQLSTEPDLCFLCIISLNNVPRNKALTLAKDQVIRFNGRFAKWNTYMWGLGEAVNIDIDLVSFASE